MFLFIYKNVFSNSSVFCKISENVSFNCTEKEKTPTKLCFGSSISKRRVYFQNFSVTIISIMIIVRLVGPK